MINIALGHSKLTVLQHNQYIQPNIPGEDRIVLFALPTTNKLIVTSHINPSIFKDQYSVFPVLETNLILDLAGYLFTLNYLFEQLT